MSENETDFERGYRAALDAVSERLEGVAYRMANDAGDIGETTRAVLGAVHLALDAESEAYDAAVEAEARVERVRGAAR